MRAPPLSAADRKWALDHSTRRYRVRGSLDEDHPGLACGAASVANSLTIIELRSGKRTIVARLEGWRDSDRYTEDRLARCRAAAARIALDLQK